MAQGQAAPATPGARPAPFDPVASIKAILDAEKAPPPPAPAAAPPQPPQSEQPVEAPPQPETEGEAAPEGEAPAAPNSQVEGAAAPDAEPQEIPVEQLEAIPLEVKVKDVDGKDVVEKRTVKELREGYMRQQDYSRKTAELARQREGVQSEIRQGIEGERAAYFQTLQTLQDTLIGTMDPELKGANWSELAANDPATYVRLDNRRKEMDRVLSEIQSKQRELLSKRDAERAQARNEQARKSIEILESKIPGWSDAHYQKLMKAAIENYGYKPDDVAQWTDHKAFEILHDAYQFRQLKATAATQKPVTEKKVVIPPKAVAPGAAAPATAAQARETEAVKKLQKSGRIEDAAAVIKARMGPSR